jgi:predicted dienelactone hydrolase
MAQELVSHGYIVATVDHPHDAYVEFPDGRLAVPDDEPTTPWTHADDVLFVLDRLEKMAAGHNPGQLPLPAGLAAALDPRHVGVYGFSKGAPPPPRHLRGVRSRLLDGPSRAFPEVQFLP